MASARQLKTNWKNRISQDPSIHWHALFEDMFKHLNKDFPALHALYTRKSEFEQTYAKELQGTLSFEQARLQYNILTDAMLRIIDQVNNAYIGGEALQESDTLTAQLKKLGLKAPLTPLQVVNCDRIERYRSFNKAFRKWEKEKCHSQFYFSLGCNTQKPDGMAERIVFEIIKKKLHNHSDSFLYPRDAEHRLQIQELPLGIQLNDCQQAFQKYIFDRFNLPHGNFERFLKEDLPKRKEGFIVFPFLIPTNDWDSDVIQDYLHWLMQHFGEVDQKGPTCIFIFVIYLKNAHLRDEIKFDLEILEDLEDFIAEQEEKSCFLYPLKEVPRYYFEKWLRGIARHLTNEEVNAIINTHIQNFLGELPEDHEKDEFLINMEHIQRLQEQIWQLQN